MLARLRLGVVIFVVLLAGLAAATAGIATADDVNGGDASVVVTADPATPDDRTAGFSDGESVPPADPTPTPDCCTGPDGFSDGEALPPPDPSAPAPDGFSDGESVPDCSASAPEPAAPTLGP